MELITTHTKPYVRILVMLVALLTALLISNYFTGSPLPVDEKHALVFQNALLLIVLGSTILEYHFTKPADSLINSLMATITLVGVYGQTPILSWWLVTGYCIAVFTASSLCISSSAANGSSKLASVINRVFYKPAIVLGKARLIFSMVFLYGIYSFYSINSQHALTLIIFWGFFMAIWPLGIPEILSSFRLQPTNHNVPVGKLLRVDNPNILRFSLDGDTDWKASDPLVYKRADKSEYWIMPLYSHFTETGKVGTAITLGRTQESNGTLMDGCVYALGSGMSHDEIMNFFQQEKGTQLVGFVTENSRIENINFEVGQFAKPSDGMLVWCEVNDTKIFYQIRAGTTAEEGLDGDKHGYQVAEASQLGTLGDKGFQKYDWLPNMNAPVFSLSAGKVSNHAPKPDNQFEYGIVPKSSISVYGDFISNMNHHTAILGVTGSGKTEFAFDLIRHAVGQGTKVICIDLTSQYSNRLSDLNPVDLSVKRKTADALSEKLFDVEVGAYGAGEEKKVLRSYSDKLRAFIEKKLGEFLTDKENGLGLIQLKEISNSQASIYITEIYMSCLLSFAKENVHDLGNIMVVVEEAHTVMPETGTMGIQDFTSKGLIAKISQLALQGRKYNIGLVVLAQRTANVSKTVLTQCNSIVSFTTYDETSINFLKNIIGRVAAEAVPNLRRLNALVFGKIVNSERPIIVEIPYDEAKANMTWKEDTEEE